MHLNFFMKTMDFRKDQIKISVNYKLAFHDTRNVKHYLKNIRLGYFSQWLDKGNSYLFILTQNHDFELYIEANSDHWFFNIVF